jgi:hypothetical protein
VCPFCGAALAATSSQRTVLGRVSRAVVFGAALAGTAACGGKKAKSDTTTQTPQTSTADAGTTLESVPADPPPKDADHEPAPAKMPYGAPPARRRIV